MRKSRQEAAETRLRIIEASTSEFRSKGINGVGLSGLMAAAGLTHGGFYKHFDSKEQVVKESVSLAMDRLAEVVDASTRDKVGLDATITHYLSKTHRDNLAGGCPVAALGSELARCGPDVQEATTVGFHKLLDVMASKFEGLSPALARERALTTLSTMVGALTLSRMINDEAMSEDILQQARKQLGCGLADA